MAKEKWELLRPSPAAILASIGLGLSCAWWNLLHEIAFYYMETYEAQATNCFLGFIGGCIAGCAIFALRRKGRMEWLSRRARIALVIRAAVLMALYYVLIAEGPFFYGTASLCYIVLNASFYILLMYVLKDLMPLPVQQVVLALAGAAGVYAMVELFGQAIYFSEAPTLGFGPACAVRLAAHVALLVASSLILMKIARKDQEEAALVHSCAEHPFHAPAALVINVVFYSIIFGVIHNLASGIVSEPVMKLTPNHVGMFLGALLFFFSFAFRGGNRVWVTMRAVVFPVTMVGFILLPLSEDKAAVFSVLVGDCATVNYYLVFLLACVSISRRANLDILKVASLGIALAAGSFVLGDIGSSLLRTEHLLGTSTYVGLTLTAFLMLIAATFWTGDDRDATLLWGLEEKRAPRRFDVDLLNARCDAIASIYGLSAREDDVLRLLVQEKKPDQIKDELFISLATVRSHIHRIYVKLDVHSNTQLMDLVEGVPLAAEDGLD